MSNKTRIILSASAAVAVFVLFLLSYPQLMAAREQMQLLVYDGDYLWHRLMLPGGMAQYLGELLVQFFVNPVYGAAIYALLFGVVQLLTARLTGSSCRYWLTYVPSVVLCWLWTVPHISMTLTVAVLLSLLLLNMVWMMRPRAALCTVAALLPLAYWLVGPAIMLVVVVVVAMYIKRAGRRFHGVMAGIGMSLLLLACVYVSSLVVRYPLRQLLAGIDYVWPRHNVGSRDEMLCDLLLRGQRWTELAERYGSSAHPTDNLAIRNAALLAQWNIHHISQQELLQGLTFTNKTLRGVSSAFIMSEVALQTGMVSISQRAAFEAMEAVPNYNKSARALRRLVETNIITGQYEVALKYIDILSRTLFYRRWAQKMRPLALHPERLDGQRFYQQLQQVYNSSHDTFFY